MLFYGWVPILTPSLRSDLILRLEVLSESFEILSASGDLIRCWQPKHSRAGARIKGPVGDLERLIAYLPHDKCTAEIRWYIYRENMSGNDRFPVVCEIAVAINQHGHPEQVCVFPCEGEEIRTEYRIERISDYGMVEMAEVKPTGWRCVQFAYDAVRGMYHEHVYTREWKSGQLRAVGAENEEDALRLIMDQFEEHIDIFHHRIVDELKELRQRTFLADYARLVSLISSAKGNMLYAENLISLTRERFSIANGHRALSTSIGIAKESFENLAQEANSLFQREIAENSKGPLERAAPAVVLGLYDLGKRIIVSMYRKIVSYLMDDLTLKVRKHIERGKLVLRRIHRIGRKM